MKRLALVLSIVACLMFAVSFSANAEFENYVLNAACVDGVVTYSVAGDATAAWYWHNGDCLKITVKVLQSDVQMATETQTYYFSVSDPSQYSTTTNWEVTGSFADLPCGPLTVTSQVVWLHACGSYIHHDTSKQMEVNCECMMYGCTPGYWKQVQHFDSWSAPYVPYGLNATLFDNAADSNGVSFDNAFPDKTLLQVLQQGGGGLNALGRHTVAALLNAASGFYPLTPAEVISMFNAIYPGTNEDYETLKYDYFEKYNEQDCPLN